MTRVWERLYIGGLADAEELAARQKKLEAALAKVDALFARWSELHETRA